MDIDAAFNAIRSDMAAGHTKEVGPKVMAIAEATDDSFTLIKCMSLLKVVNDDTTMTELLRKIMETLGDDTQKRIEIAGALRGLDYPMQAYDILKTMEQTDSIMRMSSLCLMELDEYEMALGLTQRIANPTIGDRIMLAEIQSALGEHTMAINTATELLAGFPKEYEVMRCYVSTLILGGHEKDAMKYGRMVLKDKTADANAIAAYVMRVLGNVKAAGGYATRAIQLDNKHIGAMETLGICLAQKGEYDKARIVAGAINEASPGNKAALNIIGYCDDGN